MLVDTGWNTAESRDALRAGLATIGVGIEDVRGIMLTHMHPDHCGLAGEIRRESGAWIGAHPHEVAAARQRHGLDAAILTELPIWLRLMGVPDDEADAMVAWRRDLSSIVPLLELDRVLEDGAKIDAAGRELVAILTPGHSPGHLCFHDRSRRLLFSGDLVLPRRIAPVGSYSLNDTGDRLYELAESLQKAEALEAHRILPGHGEPFDDLRRETERTRGHHERRMANVAELLEESPMTAWDATVLAPWSRRWEELSAMAKLLALAKVHAYLMALVRNGHAACASTVPFRFAAVTAESH